MKHYNCVMFLAFIKESNRIFSTRKKQKKKKKKSKKQTETKQKTKQQQPKTKQNITA